MTFDEKNTWKPGRLDQATVDKMVKHAIDPRSYTPSDAEGVSSL